jgi:succinate dehydrogenase/fumarate reductase flavoprotein subunit
MLKTVNTQLVIVGGGSAGIAAAFSAAKAGMKVNRAW